MKKTGEFEASLDYLVSKSKKRGGKKKTDLHCLACSQAVTCQASPFSISVPQFPLQSDDSSNSAIITEGTGVFSKQHPEHLE